MKRTLLALVLGASVAAAPAAAGDSPSPQQQLDRALAGRVAGEPVDCVSLSRVRNSRIIEGTAILYDEGSTIYVNRPRSGAEELSSWDTQVSRTLGDRLCSTDTVRMVDPSTGFLQGIVFLGEFVPYRRARD